MSIALDNNRIEQVSGSGYLRMTKMPPCNLPILDHEDRGISRVRVLPKEEELDQCSSSSSSIGNNSDDDEHGGVENNDQEEEEVQSKLKSSSPFDSAVDALEQALPMRRGISKFYDGKSKSFTSLADAVCTSSIKDITKPENAYTRKRKNLLSYTLLHNKTQGGARNRIPRSPAGLPRRPMMKSSMSSVALGTIPSHHHHHDDDGSVEDNGSSPETGSRNSSVSPPPSPPGISAPQWRSFSVADLQHCAAMNMGMNMMSSSKLGLMGKRNKHDEVS